MDYLKRGKRFPDNTGALLDQIARDLELVGIQTYFGGKNVNVTTKASFPLMAAVRVVRIQGYRFG